ncbi:hypothetical protein [Campylobacter fetus]|uniref:hypothetical protein n=1 Tax=Campylobacter fetus TaxID=196 RepID=UPI00138E14FD|nr:hypothetical protein [Campylobacter fetus]
MQVLTALPEPPSSKNTTQFDAKADAFVNALPIFTQQINTLSAQMQEEFQTVANNATAVATQLQNVKDYANISAANLAQSIDIRDSFALNLEELKSIDTHCKNIEQDLMLKEKQYELFLQSKDSYMADLESLKTTFLQAISGTQLSAYITKTEFVDLTRAMEEKVNNAITDLENKNKVFIENNSNFLAKKIMIGGI